jgi:Mg-chelatase subunit ChlD
VAEIIQNLQLQSPVLLLLLPLGWLILVGLAWPRRFKPFGAFLIRLVIIVLVALALAQPVYVTEFATAVDPQEKLVLLVDQSASLGDVGRQALAGEAARLAAAHPQALTVFFAKQPVLVADSTGRKSGAETSGQDPPEPEIEPAADLDPEATNLAEALSLAGRLVGQAPGRIVLLSDGTPSEGDTLAAASDLARRRLVVEVLAPEQADLRTWRGGQSDVQLVRLRVPPELRQGETFTVEVLLYSETLTQTGLTLAHNGETMAEDVVSLEPGLNSLSFSATAQSIGPQTFQATLTAEADRVTQNNSLSAFTQVYPPPQLLVIGESRTVAGRFAGMLNAAGYQSTVMPPGDLPDRLSALEPYVGMVLLDVPARAFELEQMLAVQEFARSLGRGVVVTGGRNSFAYGGYEGTPLAGLLPVDLEPPPREERPPVALLLIIDHSGSMIETQGDTPTRLAMAKEAAIRATDILGPEDRLGVLMFDNQFEWVVPFQQIEDGAALLEIQQRIARIPAGGGTRILQALEIALPVLMEEQTAVARHAVLLTDGKSFDGQSGVADYEATIARAVETGITLSTIAIGTGADVDLLEYLAGQGRGRYHFAETPEELPALTVSESDILRSSALAEGDFAAAIFEPHPLTRGFFAARPEPGQPSPPHLSAYLAMTPKPRSEIALQVGPGDPLLSVWGYGLGRVVAWSTDVGQEWATDWLKWSEYSRFWGQVIGYTLPAPDLGLLQLETEREPDGTLALVAESVDAAGQPVDRARTQVRLQTPGGQERQFSLRQVAPGRYEQGLRLPDPGAYQVTVTQGRGDEPEETVTTGFVINYPAEYDTAAAEGGTALLNEIARLTGGRALSLGEIEQVRLPSGEAETASTEVVSELWPWLLLVALLLWPLEIALRRWGRLRIQ